MIKVLKQQQNTMVALRDLVEELGDKDCYDRISVSSKPRELTKAEYTNVYDVPVQDLRCMISGISFTELLRAAPSSSSPKNPVTLSHLLPRNANSSERLALGYKMSDIEDLRNTLLLGKRFEQAYDQKFVSLVPSDLPFSSNRYKLHIWVDVIRDEPIYEGASLTIGSFEGKPLDLRVGTKMHNPFKRALSYQAFRAFKMWGKRAGLTELPTDSDTSVYEGTYRMMRAKYAQQLARDTAADAEDEDENASEIAEEKNDENDDVDS